MAYWQEFWQEVRPYSIKLIADFLICTLVWSLLFIFKLLTKSLEIHGWAGDLIVNMHSAGAVGAFIIFVTLLLIDIYAIRKSEQKEKKQ